jgi:hypothetical protein
MTNTPDPRIEPGNITDPDDEYWTGCHDGCDDDCTTDHQGEQ